MIMRQGLECLHILRQARTTICKTGFEIIWTDIELLVFAEYLHHLVAVNIQFLADVSHLVTKHNLQRVIGIVDLFHHLCHADVCADELSIDAFVYLAEYCLCFRHVSTNQCQWRIEIILDGRTLAQKLRIADDGEIDTSFQAACLFDDLTNSFIRSRQYSRANSDNVPQPTF